jgi:hypothetical protein
MMKMFEVTVEGFCRGTSTAGVRKSLEIEIYATTVHGARGGATSMAHQLGLKDVKVMEHCELWPKPERPPLPPRWVIVDADVPPNFPCVVAASLTAGAQRVELRKKVEEAIATRWCEPEGVEVGSMENVSGALKDWLFNNWMARAAKAGKPVKRKDCTAAADDIDEYIDNHLIPGIAETVLDIVEGEEVE